MLNIDIKKSPIGLIIFASLILWSHHFFSNGNFFGDFWDEGEKDL